MLQFPLDDLLDEQACYDFLLRVLHPDGLRCPQGHALPTDQAAHDRHRAPILDERCRSCGAIFNLVTGTIWAKSHYRCTTIVQILRGIAQGVPTKHCTRMLGRKAASIRMRRTRPVVGRIRRGGMAVGRPIACRLLAWSDARA